MAINHNSNGSLSFTAHLFFKNYRYQTTYFPILFFGSFFKIVRNLFAHNCLQSLRIFTYHLYSPSITYTHTYIMIVVAENTLSGISRHKFINQYRLPTYSNKARMPPEHRDGGNLWERYRKGRKTDGALNWYILLNKQIDIFIFTAFDPINSKSVHMLTPSKLSLLEECARCFWLECNKKLKRPQGLFSSLPNALDRMLKKRFDSFRQKGILPPELSAIKGAKLFDDWQLLEKWRNNFRGLTVFDSEGNGLKGAFDEVLVIDSCLVPLDFKSRGSPPKDSTIELYRSKLNVYNLLLHGAGKTVKDYAYLLFYFLVEEQNSIKFNAQLVKVQTSIADAEKLLEKAVAILNGLLPEHNPDCAFCRWALGLPPKRKGTDIYDVLGNGGLK